LCILTWTNFVNLEVLKSIREWGKPKLGVRDADMIEVGWATDRRSCCPR
jgi:hypothetical protein